MRTLKSVKQGDFIKCVSGQFDEGLLEGTTYQVTLVNGDVVWLKDDKQRERFLGRERFQRAFMLHLDKSIKM